MSKTGHVTQLEEVAPLAGFSDAGSSPAVSTDAQRMAEALERNAARQAKWDAAKPGHECQTGWRLRSAESCLICGVEG